MVHAQTNYVPEYRVSQRTGAREKTTKERLGSSVVFSYRYVMWNMSLVWWEFVLRGIIIYVFLIVLLRLTGKRQVGQLAPFDLVLLLVLSNAVQNAMNGGDNSVIGGMISAVTLVGINWIVGLLTYKSKGLERLIDRKSVV